MAGALFKGDTRKLELLARKMRKVGTREFREAVNRKLAEESLHLAHDGFERSITPYGVRWRNPKNRDGMPLRDTRRLEASIMPESGAAFFGLETSVIYAAPHQWGWAARNIPRRQFLPDAANGFGGRWSHALEAIVRNEVARAIHR